MKRKTGGGGLIIGLSTSNMMSVGLAGISGFPPSSIPNYVYLTDSSGVLYQLDPTTLKTIKTLQLASTTVAFTTDGTYLYASSGNTLYKIDQLKLSIVASMGVNAASNQSGLTYNGKYIYIGRQGTGGDSIDIIDPETMTVIFSATPLGYNWGLTYDGNYIYGGLGGPA